ncbi:fibronectin type III domain-containing protein [Marinobacter sp. S6332]|uniref:fibronectin type III domain-containing protein n=1 Tax=Marinobacter sp. S6332 TaxID=2926403 RepID=UPI001FF67366|nr:fibronectin type III domain-containing protein [Marinobacter sp. S6332]MCK0164921.1 fibronectin type III domain-containing protein [Marinobacter sp. S6332]
MERVIKLSQAWIATFALGILLTGCGGSSDPTYSGLNSLDRQKTAVLSWSAPRSRVNGEGIRMAELDKYIIRYGTNASALDKEIIIADAQKDADMVYVVRGLDAGVWYFTILVQDTGGLLSAPSEMVSKGIEF